MSKSSSDVLQKSASGPGRPKDLAKRIAILQAARNLFLQSGYDGSSMDAIAAEAKVSKLTVYRHFSDKETLFAAAIEVQSNFKLPTSLFDLAEDTPITQALYTLACSYLEFIRSKDTLEMLRLVVSITAKAPAQTQLFYNAGPRRSLAETARFLQQAQDQGKLYIPNVKIAAEYFLSGLNGGAHYRRLLGVNDVAVGQDHATSEEYIQEVVKRFVRAYAVE